MALRQLLRRGATVASVVIPTSQRAVACPVVASLRYVSSTSVTQLPLDGSKMPSATESEEEEGREPSGTPWTPAPVAEDYEETIQILLESHKVEDALDIFGRMIKRGFRPSSNITDELYAVAKTKPEWQAAAVKALDGLP
ncbi:pentatricopeptide repeat containing protein [Nannochloropsis oceanica]